MKFTAEELAVYGLIDAETYVRLSEEIIAGGAAALEQWGELTAEAREQIRMRAAERWRHHRQANADSCESVSWPESPQGR
jgi:hypothetical protein